MVVSKKHLRCLAEIPKNLVGEYSSLCRKIEGIIHKEFGECFSLDYGPGGQSIGHQHTHFIPLKCLEYKIRDLISGAIIPTGMKFEKGDIPYLRKVYASEGDYIWFGVNGDSYVYHIDGKYNPRRHFNWRYFLSKIKKIESIPEMWTNITPELKIRDEGRRSLTKEKLLPYFR
jgi:diadenosine tetraphosphate (Ap4A) HIT family hydrolase